MFDDFKELLSIFNAHNVKYLIVGGYAVSFYAQPRATKDIDLIKTESDNARAVYEALQKFGAPLDGLTPDDFIDTNKFFRMGRAPLVVDILPGIEGIEFDQAWQNRVEAVIESQDNLTADFNLQGGSDRGEISCGTAAGYCRCRRLTTSEGLR